MRNSLPFGALPAATSVGEMKSAMLLLEGVEDEGGDDADDGQARRRSGRVSCDGISFLGVVVLLSRAKLALQTGDGGLSIAGDDRIGSTGHDERGDAEGTPDVERRSRPCARKSAKLFQ